MSDTKDTKALCTLSENIGTAKKLREVAIQAASVMQGKDWHKLSRGEELLCEMLKLQGFIKPNKPANGFIGKATHYISA